MKLTAVVGLTLLTGISGSLANAQTRINAAGATFPSPIYTKWFAEFKTVKGVEINYQSIGSGGGIRQLEQGTVDVGASDKPLTDEQASKMKSKPLHFPTVLGAVVPTYNLSGVSKDLNFTGETLAGIFLGNIKKWNEAPIKSANPGVNLPDADIIVIHRSDGSGTSFVFTDFLSKVSPEWKSKVGADTSVNWPLGLAQKGNEGVAGLVKQTPNSIGYVELVYAIQNKMGYGSVKNAVRQVRESESGERDRGRGRSSGVNASRFPRLHHQRARRRRLPHLHVHVAAGSEHNFGRSQTYGHRRLPSLDANQGPDLQREPRLRQASGVRGCPGRKANLDDQVAWQVLWPSPNGFRNRAPTSGRD